MSAVQQGRLKATVMDADQIRRSLSRIAHEIVERNRGAGDVVLVGVIRRGDHLARRLAVKLAELEGAPVLVGTLDTSNHRDDRHLREPAHRTTSNMPSVDGKVVVLVDDVIHRGRTARAAMDALMDFGRPKAIQLAVLVDRGLCGGAQAVLVRYHAAFPVRETAGGSRCWSWRRRVCRSRGSRPPQTPC